MKKLKRVTRYDSNTDPGFVKRVQAAYVTAAEAEQALTGAGGMSGSEAARLRMLGRRGLLADGGSAEAARLRMIQRRERREQ